MSESLLLINPNISLTFWLCILPYVIPLHFKILSQTHSNPHLEFILFISLIANCCLTMSFLGKVLSPNTYV